MSGVRAVLRYNMNRLEFGRRAAGEPQGEATEVVTVQVKVVYPGARASVSRFASRTGAKCRGHLGLDSLGLRSDSVAAL